MSLAQYRADIQTVVGSSKLIEHMCCTALGVTPH